MRENLRLARLYLVVLAIFTVGRWMMGVRGVPYERGHQVFSIVIMTVVSCLYYAAFCRRWRGYKVLAAMGLAFSLGLMSQIVIFGATALSYALGMDTYFTHPRALNVEAPLAAGPALAQRAMAIVGNSLGSGIIGALGWALGGLLPER